jgi:hypothetical protein
MPFLLFYLILIIFFALYFGILGLGNFNVGGDQGVYRSQVIAAWEANPVNSGKTIPANYHFESPSTYIDYPGAAQFMPQYMYIPKFFAYWLSTLNVSLGNFDYSPS